MVNKCPNKSSKFWKDIVAKYGENGAWALYIANGEDIPSLKRAETLIARKRKEKGIDVNDVKKDLSKDNSDENGIFAGRNNKKIKDNGSTNERMVGRGEIIFPADIIREGEAKEDGLNYGRAREASEVLWRASKSGMERRNSGRFDAEDQEQVLREWARENNAWISPNEVKSWDYISSGVESRVYLRDGYAYKIGYNYRGTGYNNALEWISNKIYLNNQEFPSEEIELVGFTETYGFDNSVKGPFFAPVFRQKWVDGNLVDRDKQSLIDDELRKMGWTQISETSWEKGDVRIKDIHTDNVIIDKNGDFHFIDTQPEVVIKDGWRNSSETKVINERGEIDYVGLDRQRISIERGSAVFDRFMVQFEKGRLAAGARAEEASIIAGANIQANAYQILNGGNTWQRGNRAPTWREIEEEAYREEELLTKYAIEKGIWYDHNDIFGRKLYAKGSEANIYLEGNDSVIKAYYNYTLNHDNMLQFIDDIALFNDVFPDTKYELFGFTETENGRFAPILKQEFREGNHVDEHDSESMEYYYRLITDYMRSRGFRYDTERDAYYNDYIVIFDLHPGNVLFGKDNVLYVVDANVRPNVPVEPEDVAYEYEESGKMTVNPGNVMVTDFSDVLNVSDEEIEESVRKCK